MYAVDSASTSFLTALLRRGGDPNARVHATVRVALLSFRSDAAFIDLFYYYYIFDA